MKKLLLIPFLLFTSFVTAVCGDDGKESFLLKQPEMPELSGGKDDDTPGMSDGAELKVNITVGSRTVAATMENNAAARDLLSRLPLEVTLNDFNNTTEKIFYPNPALTLDGVPRGCAPVPGDITIYAPWGNVAIFCKEWPYSDDLVKIGHIDGEGIDALDVGGDIRVRIEKPWYER